MAIKKLQNDFTTPEQSKRLLELGVPADSANYQYYAVGEEWGWEKPALRDESKPLVYNCTPCWSVGRLIEIYCTCRECTWEYITNNPPIEDMLCDIELCIGDLDFSKLEDRL